MINSFGQRLSLIERLHRGRAGPLLRTLVSRLGEPGWLLRGRLNPCPPHKKRSIVESEVRRHGVTIFVETGTYRGDTLARVAPLVERAVSIELDSTLAELAKERFRRRPNVEIRTGDSATELAHVVASLDRPALFWLDGHYSGGLTADSGSSPILAEIDVILDSPHDHVVLIDDMRLFDGTDGYPTLHTVRAAVEARRPDWVFDVTADIARLHAGPIAS